MNNETKVLTLMQEAGRPVSASEIEKASDLDRKTVDKVFKLLKEQGRIVSPIRCKWEPAEG